MNSEIERENQIESYVQDRMNPEEKSAFEVELNVDSSLRIEVDQLLKIKKYYQRMKEEDFKKKILSIQQELDKEEAEPKNIESGKQGKIVPLKPWYSKWGTWAAAASVVLLGSYFMFFSGPDYDELAATALQDYSSNTRGIAPGSPGPDYYYSQEQYQEAIQRANEILTVTTSDTTAYDLKKIIALSTIGIGKPQKALLLADDLKPVDASDCEIDMIRTIAFIKMERKEDALTLLLSFKGPKCGREEKIAQEILVELK